MTHSDPNSVDLLLLSRREAARIAARAPGAEDRWAPGFPRDEDCGPAARVAAATRDPGPFGVYKLVARRHGRTIGTAGFYGRPDAAGEVTIGYGMVEPERGQGYGTEAVAGLVAICRAHGGVTVINADTSLDNAGSRRVLEKNGFRRLRSSDTLHYYALQLAPLSGQGPKSRPSCPSAPRRLAAGRARLAPQADEKAGADHGRGA